jgi:hypothetical protein
MPGTDWDSFDASDEPASSWGSVDAGDDPAKNRTATSETSNTDTAITIPDLSLSLISPFSGPAGFRASSVCLLLDRLHHNIVMSDLIV